MSIYDFSDPDWTTETITSEHALADRLNAELVEEIGDRQPTAEEGKTNRNYVARALELQAELNRRGKTEPGKAATTATRARLGQPNRESGKGPTFDTFGNYGPHPRSAVRNDELSTIERLALVVLADAWNPSARYVKMSLSTLAARVAVNRSTARDVVTRLEAKEWITKQPGSGHGANRFRFTAKVREPYNENDL